MTMNGALLPRGGNYLEQGVTGHTDSFRTEKENP